jgi:hypothetical protein
VLGLGLHKRKDAGFKTVDANAPAPGACHSRWAFTVGSDGAMQLFIAEVLD